MCLAMMLSVSLFVTPVFAEGGNTEPLMRETFTLEPLMPDEPITLEPSVTDIPITPELPVTDVFLTHEPSVTDMYLTTEPSVTDVNPIPELLDPLPFTPEGNLSLIDDIEGEQSQEKQFITMQSKNGNFFYLVIDRDGDKENVYFLNLVDEVDLLALIEDDSIQKVPTQCDSCTVKCEIGSINTDCPVCSVDKNACNGINPEQIEPVEMEEISSSPIGMIVVVLIIGFIGGGFYYFKIKQPKQTTKGNTNLDEYDFEDDDEDEYESEKSEDMQEEQETTESEGDTK